MSPLCLLLAVLVGWCALAPGNVHVVDRPVTVAAGR